MNRIHRSFGAAFAVVIAPWICAQSAPTPATHAPESQGWSVDAFISQPSASTEHSAAFPAEASGWGPRFGQSYYASRWAEDWSFMREGAGSNDPYDQFKFIALNDTAERYLTLSYLSRMRYIYTDSPDVRDAADRTLFLLRTHVGADVHLGPSFRLYGELASGQAGGRNIPAVNGSLRNDLVAFQAFAELARPAGDAILGLRIGREEFMDGSRVLIGPRDPNIHNAFNGARAYAIWPKIRVNLFAYRPTTHGTGVFDDGVNHHERLRGLNASIVLPQVKASAGTSALYLDPFVYEYEVENKAWGGVRSMDKRDVYGVRLWGRNGRFSLDWTAARQTGTFVRRRVTAYGLFASQSVLLDEGPLQPRIGVRFDYASGGGAYRGGELENFTFMYGNPSYFSDDGYIGATNLVAVTPTFSLSLSRSVKVVTELGFWRRADRSDAAYNGNMVAYAQSQNLASRDIGTMGRTIVTWDVDRHNSWTALVNVFDASKGIESLGYADAVYATVFWIFRF